ncbi:MAG: GWxTD domain-containing protein [Proteobacteria bacterium]|nr:GWxTD domain-containing protein [Pseudomonadota bacterium]
MERVNELVYISTPSEIRKLKNAPESKRDSLWSVFWKKRDPVPTTEKNEAEIEYFKRVEYANKKFTSYKPGWKTDRGMIYIKYGPPDDIESFPYNIDSEPYEIWYYSELHKRFVFVDKYGWGDYQLVY